MFLLATLCAPVSAQETEQDSGSQDVPGIIQLAEAYQTGYLQVVALSCFQLYSSTGIIATDFANGHINGGTAISALEQNSLLTSACLTTLADIRALTPEDDPLARAELSRLHALLTAEYELIAALTDTFTDPTEENAARAEAARKCVEDELDTYAGPPVS